MPKKSAVKQNRYPAPSSGLEARSVMEVKAGVFKDTCLQLLDDVRDRDLNIVVTKYGEPVARITPADDHVPSAFGFMSGTVLEQDDIVAPDFDAWGEE
jgi:antitoxin (DNA-binding transcriptional repressor) of toxin-antitoxin stability system